MSTDMLAQYRRKGAVPAAPPEAQEAPETEPTGYRAIGVVSGNVRPLRLELRAAKGLAIARPYSSIIEIAYDRDGYTGILIMFPAKLVTVQGRDLRPVVEALLAGTAEFIAQLRDGEQPQSGAPVVEQITTGSGAAKPPPRGDATT